MDVARPPEVARQRKRRQIIIGVSVLLVVAATTIALSRLKPAAPTVEAGTLWIDAVKRGTMLRQVRGTGVLVPDEIRWVTALTDGLVENVLVQPGAVVAADTVIVELRNPQTEQAALTAALDLKTAEAQYEVLKADLERDILAERSSVATADADAAQTAMDAEANDAMAKQGLISAIAARQSRLRADTSVQRRTMEHARLTNSEQTIGARLSVQRAEVDRRQLLAAQRRNEAVGLRVRAGHCGGAAAGAGGRGPAHRPRDESGARGGSDALAGAAPGGGDAGEGRHRSARRPPSTRATASLAATWCGSTPPSKTEP